MRPLFSLAGVAVLALLLSRVGWRDLLSSFQRLGGSALIVLLGLGIVEHLIDCEASRRAMLGRIGVAWTVATTSAGVLANLVIPFEAGELLKLALLRRRSTDTSVASGVVIWNYVWKLAKPLAIAGCFLLALALGHVYPAALWRPVLLGVALSFGPYLALRFLLRHHPAERLMRVLAQIPRLGRRAQGWLAAASRLDCEIRDFGLNHRRAYLHVFALTLLGRFLGLATLFVMAAPLGLPTDLGSVAFVYAAQTVAEYLAMLLPARVGLGEGTAYLVFTALGLPPTTALVVVLVLRARSVVVTGLPALWALAQRGAHKPSPARPAPTAVSSTAQAAIRPACRVSV